MQELREIRDKMSLEIMDMTHEQIMAYFKNQKAIHSTKSWEKNK
jgi:hypothetical protein